MNCPICGRAMRDIGGIGEELAQWICNHSNCPSHYQNRKCPQCANPPASVDVLGIGAKVLECEHGHSWSEGV